MSHNLVSVSVKDLQLIKSIVERYEDLCRRALELQTPDTDSFRTFVRTVHVRRTAHALSLLQCHVAIPLDLERLAEACDFVLVHDVSGIHHHWDQEELRMKDCFLPRCARPIEEKE